MFFSVISIDIIAQELNWAKTIELAGSNTNSMVRVQKSVTDKENNIYLYGDYDAPLDFKTSTNSYIKNDVAFQDAFLVKYNSNGDFQWVKTWGSRSYWTYATGLTIDNDGNLTIVLNTRESFDVDPDTSVVNIVDIYNKNTDVLLKLDNNGKYLWHQRMMETNLSMRVMEMKYDIDNYLYITGFAYNTTAIYPYQSNTVAVDIAPGTKVSYVIKADHNGNMLWAQQMHSDNEIEGYGITPYKEGVEIVGYFKGNATLNPDDINTYYRTHPSTTSAYWLSLDGDGRYLNLLVFDNEIMGKDLILNKIQFDEFGNRYLAGNFTGRFNVKDANDANRILETSSTALQSFLLKYDDNCNVKWQRTLTTTGATQVYNLLVDSDNNVVMTGVATGNMYINLPIDSTVIQYTSMNSGFVVKYNEEGELLLHVGQTGQNGSNFFNGTAVDNNNNILVANYSTGDLAYNCFPTFISEPSMAPASNGSRISFFSIESCNSSNFELYEEYGAIYANIQHGTFTWYDMDNNGAVITDATSYAILPTASGRFRARLKTENGCIYYSDIITFNKPTNIQDEKEALYAIYPNPVVDVLHLESKSVISQVQILDAAGRLVFQEKYTNAKVNIKTSAFTKGLYTMLVWDNDGQKTAEKFVKF